MTKEFNKQFPSLKKKRYCTGADWMERENILIFDDKDDKDIDKTFIYTKDIQKYCVDKQKIINAISLATEAEKEEGYMGFRSVLLKELGLEKGE